MANLFANTQRVRVARPSKRAKLRNRDLDNFVTAEDIIKAVAEIAGCLPSEVRTGDIKMSPNGLGTAWVQCPLVAANKVDKTGRIQVGWMIARVGALEQRSLQCFRCMEKGYVRSKCTNPVDRSKTCYRCGRDTRPACAPPSPSLYTGRAQSQSSARECGL
jgi:hypothetical protein